VSRQTLTQRRALAAYLRCQAAYAAAPRGRKLLWWHRMRDAMTALLKVAPPAGGGA
jgi:hypothetical protein